MPKKKDRYKQRADGRYMTFVNDSKHRKPDGKPTRIPVYADSSQELEDKVAELKYLIKVGKYKSLDDITVAEYADKWLKTYKSVKELNTRKMYEDCLETHIKPELGEIKLSQLLGSDIQLMIAERMNKRRTCEIIYMTMHQIVKRAIKDGILHQDICEDVELPKKKKTKKRALTETEKKALFNADFDLADRVLVYLLYGCGLRRGEVLALRVQDIDFKKAAVRVQNVIVFDDNTPVWKEIPKSQDGEREVDIPKAIDWALRRYIRQLCGTRHPSSCQEQLLFTTRGGMVTKSSYRKTWERIIKTMTAAVATKENPKPITGLTAHIFRHNYATMLYYSGISIKKAAELMGHSDIKLIMEIYAHLDEQKENTKEKLNNTIKLAL